MKESINRAVIVVIAAITIFVLGLLLLGRFVQVRIHDMQEDKLVLESQLGAKSIQNEFLVVETFLLDIEKFIISQDDQSKLLDYLISIDQDHEFVYSVYLGYPDKSMINSSGFVPPATFDLTTRSWYQNALLSEEVVYTNVFLNATKDRLIITLSHAIYDENNQLIGVVAADVDLKMITQSIQQTSNAEYYSFLVDNEGFVLSHPSKNTESLDLVLLNEFGIDTSLFTSNQGLTEEVTFNGEKGYIAYNVLDGSSYYYGIFMESSAYNQTLTLFGVGIVSFVTLGIIIASLIVIGFQLFIVKPTNNLIQDIEELDVTNEDVLSLPIDKNDGFVSTRKAVNKLLKLNDIYRKKLSESNSELLIGLQRFDLLLSSASDIVFEIDLEGIYQKVYGNCMELFQIEPKDMIGKSFKEVFSSLDIDDRKDMYLSVLSGSNISYNWMYENNDSIHYLQTNLSPLYDEDKNVTGIVGVTRDVSEVQNQYEELLYISTHDYLTDLYNRRVIIEEIEELEKKKMYPYTIVNIDLNGLKLINDALGHQVGDLALQRTAEVLIHNTLGKDIVARVGGDEFSILLKDTGEEEAILFKKKLETAFSKEKIKNITLSVAIGFAVRVDDSISVNELRKLAENDMYRQKILDKRSVKNKTITAILKTLNDKHELERQHSENVSRLSKELGEVLKLNDTELKELETAAMFHDIGKISIPDDILYKTEALTDKEFEIMKTHTTIGYDILSAADEYSDLAIYASSHHERWDGLGYPKGIKAEQIPLFSRIISIADSFEAMTANRPYRNKMSIDYAVSEMRKGSGTQFDPVLVKLFIEEVLNKKM